MTADISLQSVRWESTTVNADNPWPGLDFYHETDKDFFHGRDPEIELLLRSVMRAPLTVLFGQSGLGKTSLLQAGLFPNLREQNVFAINIRLDYTQVDKDLMIQVKQIIKSESAKNNIEAPSEIDQVTLWEFLHRQNADFWDKSNRLMLPLLVFDQFEEIFTVGRSNPDRMKACESFLVELGDLIEGRPPQDLKMLLDKNPQGTIAYNFRRHYYKVLLSLREDYIPELEGLRERIPSIMQNRVRLQSMNGSAALEVVERARNLIEPSVAEKVVRFVAAGEDPTEELEKLEIEPALLSIVCRELNNKRQLRNEQQISDLLLEGSQEEIISNFYERSIADLPPEISTFIEDRLLTVSGYRDSIAIENAISIPGITLEAIDILVNRRLIRIEQRGEMQRLELTHDLLTRVITKSRNQRHQEEEVKKREEEITRKVRQQRLEERARSARRLRLSLVIVTILFCIATLTTLIAFRKQHQANLATKDANEQYTLANIEREKSQLLLNTMMEKEKLRNAILSRDTNLINHAYQTAALETQIKFRATAEERPYKAVDGSSTYVFKMFPVEQSIPGGLRSIAMITYIMDHPTFSNPLYSTSSDTKFTATYDGVGCLSEVKAFIEYFDTSKPPSVASFNMCEILEIIPIKITLDKAQRYLK